MKITVGGESFSEAKLAAGRYRDAVLSNIKRQVVYTGQAQMQRLAIQLDLVANAEADKLYSVLSDIIDNPSTSRSLRAVDLARGMASNPAVGGEIEWKDLSYKYLVEKARVDTRYTYAFNRRAGEAPREVGAGRFTEQRFFRFLGPLSAYFRNQGQSIVQGRMGGVKVSIDTEGLQEGNRSTVTSVAYGEDLSKLLIGRINLDIFPNIDATLLPGLASNRWTQTLANAAAEDQIFDGTKAGAKLAQVHHNSDYYRALVAPAIQFWVLIRIPAVIKDRLKTYLTRAQVRKLSDL